MTNREYLDALSSIEFAKLIKSCDACAYNGTDCTLDETKRCEGGIALWLEMEYKEIKDNA